MPLQNQLIKKIERIYCEDALKYIHTKLEDNLSASINGLKSILDISMKDTLQIVRRLEELELVEVKGDGIHLFDKGKQIALQIVRAHRLWDSRT